MRSLPRIVRIVSVTAFTVLAASSTASAQEAPPESEYRLALMDGLRVHTGALRALTRGDVSHPEHVLDHARAVLAISTMAADVFPEGSGGAETRAMDEIWSDWSGFMDKLTELQSAAAALVVAAESGGTEGVAPALQAVNRTCRGCHQPYRRPAN